MRCAFVIPSWVPEDIFSSKTAHSQINYWQPLGTLSVAAVLKQAGHTVTFLNGAFLRHEQLLRELREFQPAFIGIYSTTFGWPKAKRTAGDLRAIYGKSVFLCAGGPYPIAAQERCLEDGGLFDAAVTGEGEYTVRETVERLEQGRGLEDVRGWCSGGTAAFTRTLPGRSSPTWTRFRSPRGSSWATPTATFLRRQPTRENPLP
jgi:radical SAM superfamily enzyme YgiQ (UPF0313 family)